MGLGGGKRSFACPDTAERQSALTLRVLGSRFRQKRLWLLRYSQGRVPCAWMLLGGSPSLESALVFPQMRRTTSSWPSGEPKSCKGGGGSIPRYGYSESEFSPSYRSARTVHIVDQVVLHVRVEPGSVPAALWHAWLSVGSQGKVVASV